jgi:hypothetical protein
MGPYATYVIIHGASLNEGLEAADADFPDLKTVSESVKRGYVDAMVWDQKMPLIDQEFVVGYMNAGNKHATVTTFLEVFSVRGVSTGRLQFRSVPLRVSSSFGCNFASSSRRRFQFR